MILVANFFRTFTTLKICTFSSFYVSYRNSALSAAVEIKLFIYFQLMFMNYVSFTIIFICQFELIEIKKENYNITLFYCFLYN